MKMKRYKLLLIVLLIIGCDLLHEKEIFGCTATNAINFDSNATVDDYTCQYNSFSYWDDIETINGMDEVANPTEIIGDGQWGGCYDANLYRSVIVPDVIPISESMNPPYPNPFPLLTPSIQNTRLKIVLNETQYIKVKVMNIFGEEVISLFSGELSTGFYDHLTWNGKIENGKKAPSGIYFILVEGDNFHTWQKVTLIR